MLISVRKANTYSRSLRISVYLDIFLNVTISEFVDSFSCTAITRLYGGLAFSPALSVIHMHNLINHNHTIADEYSYCSGSHHIIHYLDADHLGERCGDASILMELDENVYRLVYDIMSVMY
jgi:hypothetical protein